MLAKFFLKQSQPKFRKNQQVFFIGGMGKVINYQQDSGMWTYAVEMEMGPEPEMGRVGPETTILLYETELDNAY